MITAEKTAELELIRLPLANLAEHEKNPRDHPSEDSLKTAALDASLLAGYVLPLVWNKRKRQDHQWQHEPVLYGWHPGAAHRWYGGFKQCTVFDTEPDLSKLSKADLITLINQMRNDRDTTIVREPRNTGNGLHPTVKPLHLVARQVWNSSMKGETVLELFGGSGTTLAASQQIGRRCVATELDPKYCAVILERMSAYGLSIEKMSAPQ